MAVSHSCTSLQTRFANGHQPTIFFFIKSSKKLVAVSG
jgi:hypothetical protein